MEDMGRLGTVLVTGGTGFIGGHLVEELIRREYQVIVPYIEIDPHSTFSLNKLSEKVILLPLDIRDDKKVLALTKKYQIDFIFHLAAQTLVTEAYENPSYTFQTNIIGTVNILELARFNKRIKGVIFASSDKAYGKTDKPYKEDFPLKGDHPYDVSKSSADLISLAYFATYQTPVVVTRFGNVYGEGDVHFDRLIPGICKAIIEKKTLEIRSDGKYVRDYLYVKDVINGYLTLFRNFGKIKGEAFNFSSNDTLSVLEVIKKAQHILGKKISYRILDIAQNEIPYQHLDDAKAQKFGWKRTFSLESALPRTFAWYEKILRGKVI